MGEGEPLLLIAGCGQPAAAWHLALVPVLVQAGFQVATYDNRGVAPSLSPPAPYNVDLMTGDALALLDHLGWSDPVHVAGHSMGGWIAETLVLDHPARVRAAALMGSANEPTAWEVAITTVERDLARLDYDLPPLFYATETLRYLPTADIQDSELVATWLSFIGDLEPWPNPGRLGQYEAALAWSTDPVRTTRWPEIRTRAWCWHSSTTWTRLPAVRPAGGRVHRRLRIPGDRRSRPHRHRHPPRRRGPAPGRVLRRCGRSPLSGARHTRTGAPIARSARWRGVPVDVDPGRFVAMLFEPAPSERAPRHHGRVGPAPRWRARARPAGPPVPAAQPVGDLRMEQHQARTVAVVVQLGHSSAGLVDEAVFFRPVHDVDRGSWVSRHGGPLCRVVPRTLWTVDGLPARW